MDDAAMSQLAGLPRLTRLNLYSSPVSDEGLKVLKTLPNLRHLFIGSTKITDAGVEQSFEELADGMRELAKSAPASDCVKHLKTGARAYIDFGLRNPSAYEFAFILRRPGAPASRKPHVAYEYLRSMAARCVEEKRFTNVDVDTAAQSVWAAVHGVTCLLIFRPSFPWSDKEAVIQKVIDSAIGGLEPSRR